MKISKEEVEKLAHLSRLELDEASIEKMQGDMDKVLNFVEKINELDIEDVAPLTYMVDEVNVLRPDARNQVTTHEEALKNAPDADSDYFKVPKVIQK